MVKAEPTTTTTTTAAPQRKGLSAPPRGDSDGAAGKKRPPLSAADRRKAAAARAERLARSELLESPAFSARVDRLRAALTETPAVAALPAPAATVPRRWEAKRDAAERAAERSAAAAADDAAFRAAAADVLRADAGGGIESAEPAATVRLTQREIAGAVDVRSARKAFDLQLPTFGPYAIDYSRNGRHLLLAGKKGHVAVLDWAAKRLLHEWHVDEPVLDAVFLQNETLLAVAQRRYLHLYDAQGTELHCLRNFRQPKFLEFLPYHFLLAEASETARIRYIDVSTGAQVADWSTRLGPPLAMCQNPWNAVVCLSHGRGVVSMWSPNSAAPLVKLLAHRAPVRSIAVDQAGTRMATAGADGLVKVWDVRTLKPIASFGSRLASNGSLAISQRGLLAVAGGPRLEVWGKDALDRGVASPYLRHVLPNALIHRLRFCPYEDFLGVGHSLGFSSVVVPGAGEPNFDTSEANPFQTPKQRREAEVHALLDKIPAAMISLTPGQVGSFAPEPEKSRAHKRSLSEKANKPAPTSAPTVAKEEDEATHEAKKQKRKAERKKKKQRKVLVFDEKDKAAEDAEAAKRQPKKPIVQQIDSALDLFTKKVVF